MAAYSDTVFITRRRSRKSAERSIVKNMSLTTAILTIIFMALVAVYQLPSDHRDLAADLTIVFSNYHK